MNSMRTVTAVTAILFVSSLYCCCALLPISSKIPPGYSSSDGDGFHLSLRMSSSSEGDETIIPKSGSKYSRMTARKRQRMSNLLNAIDVPPLPQQKNFKDDDAKNLLILDAPEIDWESRPDMDPQSREGGLLKANSPRGLRKRRQCEAFVHVCRRLLMATSNVARSAEEEGDDGAFELEPRQKQKRALIVDAGSGAGNLSIPLDGFLGGPDVGVLAVDVNEIALQRLADRRPSVKVLCADLANSDNIAMEDDPDSEMAVMVVSLHACGAATDLAIRLATDRRLPFCMSPCCSAKAVVKRKRNYGPQASGYRSSAPVDIIYPRSEWLQKSLEQRSGGSGEEEVQTAYVSLAKVADIGLGPQTLPEQIYHQKKSKRIVEWDRLMGVVESHDYRVHMYRIKDHENYAKQEILIGVPKEMGEVDF